jgi:phosphoglycolate phosphatase-like HAD superfamily hydrolase
MRRLILFDIDGTLLLTGGAGKAAFDRVFVQLYGIENAWGETHPDGRTDPNLITELFEKNLKRKPSPQEEKKVRELYGTTMAQTLEQSPRFRLMPGVERLIPRLASYEVFSLGLATGNFEETAYLKLKRAGLESFFPFGGFGSDFPDRLQLTRTAVQRGYQKAGGMIAPEDCFVVGDTIHDIRCGKLLGLTTVAIATGSTSKQELARHRPDFLLDSLEETEEVLTIFGA